MRKIKTKKIYDVVFSLQGTALALADTFKISDFYININTSRWEIIDEVIKHYNRWHVVHDI